MNNIFIICFFLWVGAVSSSVTDETADKVLGVFHGVASTAAEHYDNIERNASHQRRPDQTPYQQSPIVQQISSIEPVAQNSIRSAAQLVTQSACIARSELMAQLQNDYEEKPFLVGQNTDGRLVEVLHSSNGTFSIVSTDGNGTACLLASGENAQALKAAARSETSTVKPSAVQNYK